MSDDPIQDEQLQIVEGLLQRNLSASEFEGFLIVNPRFVDRFGGSRIAELGRVYHTDRAEGRKALAQSLTWVATVLGSYEEYAKAYPVTIIPPSPAYPLLPIIGLETVQQEVFRVLDRRKGAILDHVKKTGRLPPIPKPAEPVLRTKPRAHWCAYDAWPTPEDTRKALQILPDWSDCEARATVDTLAIADLAFVAYSLDPNDPGTKGLTFHGYFFEGVAQDHDELAYEGNAVQICVYGEPAVKCLEEWNASDGRWQVTWP